MFSFSLDVSCTQPTTCIPFTLAPGFKVGPRRSEYLMQYFACQNFVIYMYWMRSFGMHPGLSNFWHNAKICAILFIIQEPLKEKNDIHCCSQCIVNSCPSSRKFDLSFLSLNCFLIPFNHTASSTSIQ